MSLTVGWEKRKFPRQRLIMICLLMAAMRRRPSYGHGCFERKSRNWLHKLPPDFFLAALEGAARHCRQKKRMFRCDSIPQRSCHLICSEVCWLHGLALLHTIYLALLHTELAPRKDPQSEPLMACCHTRGSRVPYFRSASCPVNARACHGMQYLCSFMRLKLS